MNARVRANEKYRVSVLSAAFYLLNHPDKTLVFAAATDAAAAQFERDVHAQVASLRGTTYAGDPSTA